MSGEEQVVLTSCLKRSAAAVLCELGRRSDANMLLRAGEPHSDIHHTQLLRGAEAGLRPGEVEHLLLPSREAAGRTGPEKTGDRLRELSNLDP